MLGYRRWRKHHPTKTIINVIASFIHRKEVLNLFIHLFIYLFAHHQVFSHKMAIILPLSYSS